MHAACDPSSGSSCPSGAAYHAVGGLVGFALGLPAGLMRIDRPKGSWPRETFQGLGQAA